MAEESEKKENQEPVTEGDQAGSEVAAGAASGVAAADSASVDAEGAQRRGRGRAARVIPCGIAHITATFNNTHVSISDARGNVISWGTAGRAGFKGSRKSTAFAATTVAQDAGRTAVAKGMNEVEVRVQGAGAGRESAIRALQSVGLNITTIKDVTPIAHNGCRARKRRRV